MKTLLCQFERGCGGKLYTPLFPVRHEKSAIFAFTPKKWPDFPCFFFRILK